MRITRTIVGVLVLAASLAAGQQTPLLTPNDLIKAPLEVEEGTTWEQQVTLPALGADEAPVLYVRSRIPKGGGGGNFIMRVLLDGAPLRDNWFAPRLLNKQPNFDPPKTDYHFQWYRDTSWGNFSYSWFSVFDANPQGNWAGTGQDYDYLFSLDGLVSGEGFKLGLEHVFAGLAAALKTDRAPLLVEKLTVGKLPKTEIARLQQAVLGGLDIKHVAAVADVPAGETGVQAYELTWSGRPDPGMQVTFDRLAGWTVDYRSAGEVGLAASVAQRLWRPSVGKLTISTSDKPVAIVLRPPQPIALPGSFDAANFWVYGPLHFMDKNFSQVNATALLADARGAETVVDLGPIRMGYWMLLHGTIPEAQRAKWLPPLQFKALQLTLDRAKADYTLYLEGLHFYSRNRKPAPAGRPEKPVFPVSDRGNLPTAPAGVKVTTTATAAGARFVSMAPSGTLTYDVNLQRGCLDGITATWGQGQALRPCAGGGVLAEKAPPAGKLVDRKLAGGKLTAQWRGEDGKQWSADYRLAGRSLVVNVHATGGWAVGTAFGALEGMAQPKAVEIPYLKFARAGGTAVAVGNGLFVTVVPDLYHSDYSRVEGVVPKPDGDRLQLFARTTYTPLTDGKRNDLHDRLLVTVAPEFADVLPNHQNPRSPNLERLAPYMFIMSRTMLLNQWETLKRYGLDHVIANDFAGIFVKSYSEGFGVRWRPHPDYTIKQVQEARAQIKGLGFMYGAYIDVTDQPPLNEWWDEDRVSITATGDLAEAWPGSYCPKTDQMWVLARKTGQKMKELYPP
ncbi:MAG: hypothetical protein KKI08_19305, partial [Armatimonadetes bacterium]|nr:hypothetical protein [Armatimonadota bacterium]